MSEKEAGGTVEHVLSSDLLQDIHTWEQWRELWNSTQVSQLRHSLLHFGFDIAQGSALIVFYLEVADGHRASEWYFLTEEEKRKRYEPRGTPRRELAQKAFAVLCQRVFRFHDKERPHDLRRWITQPTFFEKVLWFFRPEPDEWHGGLFNLLLPSAFRDGKTEANYEVARNFLFEFCRLAWMVGAGGWESEVRECLRDVPSEEEREKTIQRFREARPRLIKILAGFEQLPFLLLKRAHGRLIYEVDEPCLRELENIALGERYCFPGEPGSRQAVSVEEACLAGSRAAEVLLLLRAITKEAERLEKIRDLERQRRDTEARLRKLNQP